MRLSRFALFTFAVLLLGAPTARAEDKEISFAQPFHACQTSTRQAQAFWECATINVPLDWSGNIPGKLTLEARRLKAQEGPAAVAVFALEGGPGEEALPSARELAGNMAPLLRHDDFLIINQRGTGSTSLGCRRAWTPHEVANCAHSLGILATLFTTEADARDVEAVRALSGEQKLILYGISYGTHIAQEYAHLFPAQTAGLILDSTMPPGRPEGWELKPLSALAETMNAWCAEESCPDLHGQRADSVMHRLLNTYPWESTNIARILYMGSFSLQLIEKAPQAFAEALRGRLAFLHALGEEAEGEEEAIEEGTSGGAMGDFWAQFCEDVQTPWTPAANLRERRADLRNSELHLQLDGFALKTMKTLFSVLPMCIAWPSLKKSQTEGSLPRVPALILHGDEDSVTPLAWAQEVASALPGAKLVEVPHVGHDVLDNAVSSFGRGAVSSLALEEEAFPLLALVP